MKREVTKYEKRVERGRERQKEAKGERKRELQRWGRKAETEPRKEEERGGEG